MMLYMAGFRRLDGHHFEMALQPQKVLYFFILEEVYLYFRSIRIHEMHRLKGSIVKGWEYVLSRKKVYAINFLIIAFIGSSLGYSFTRYSRRFVMAKLAINQISGKPNRDLSLLHDVEKRAVHIKRAKGMVVPKWQAEEMEGIVGFLEKNTNPDEVIFTYPELGNFNFWLDRPFVGRFPIATFAWMDQKWYKELIADFKKTEPRYAIMTNPGHRTFPEEWYFRNKANIEKHNEMTKLITDNYKIIQSYESVSLYERISSK